MRGWRRDWGTYLGGNQLGENKMGFDRRVHSGCPYKMTLPSLCRHFLEKIDKAYQRGFLTVEQHQLAKVGGMR